MKIGYFTERPYQDPALMEGRITLTDLMTSNGGYDPVLGADLYNRYLDEKVYAEEMGFDMLMLNEHHSTPFCMGGVMNVEASILARITSKAKIVLLGNVIPIWEDPLWLAETLATIDMISRGRLVSGWVRGTGRESMSHNSQSPFNWERFQEAHDFVVKAWTTPGPFRWEGEHYHYRYVNPWMRPYQQPHPPIWVPGILSKNTVEWCAKNRIPYIMLATLLEPTKRSFDFYDQVARESGYEAGPQHRGYLFKVHVDETEELAYDSGARFIEGPGNIFLEGSRAKANPFIQNLPGLTSRTQLLPTKDVFQVLLSRGRGKEMDRPMSPTPAAPETDPGGARGGPGQALRGSAGQLHDHHRHAEDGHPQGPPRPRDAPAGAHLLLGRRRRHEPRGLHAQPAAHGRRGHPGGAGDGQGARSRSTASRSTPRPTSASARQPAGRMRGAGLVGRRRRTAVRHSTTRAPTAPRSRRPRKRLHREQQVVLI